MISTYSPILRKYSSDSPDWYKDFHNVFYMSQLTNQVLLSYLESKINDDRDEMVAAIEPDLLQSKIIRIDNESGKIIVSKPEELKSIHIEDVIDQIVEGFFNKRQETIELYLRAMHLKPENSIKKEILIERDVLLGSTTSKNWFDLIKGLLNVWEFIFLYGAVESAFKNVLSINGQVREENLVGEIFAKIDNLQDHTSIQKDDLITIWSFYTELRNVYVHNHGYINERVKANLGGKLEAFKNAILNIHQESILILDLENLLKKNLVQKSKFYFMRDDELNVFRNAIIHLIESIEQCQVIQRRR